MAFRMVLGNQLVALPEKLDGLAIHGFADTPPKRVIAVTGRLTIRLCDTDQSMLAVVAVFGDELMAFAAPFADQVAEGVVVVMAVALDHQAVAGNDVRAGTVLHQQVARRVVGEALLDVLGMIGAGQAIKRVVAIVVLAFACVGQAGEGAAFVVVVLALVEVVLLLRNGVGVQAVLVVVVIVAEQLTLLALVLATALEEMRGEYFTIEFDGGEVAAFVVVEGGGCCRAGVVFVIGRRRRSHSAGCPILGALQ